MAIRRWGRRLVRVLAALCVAWLVLSGALLAAMLQPPDKFGRIMASVPQPLFVLMAVLPFEPMWNLARGGRLAPGDLAPDFELETVGDKAQLTAASRVRLSSFRGARPVVLVFGSYT